MSEDYFDRIKSKWLNKPFIAILILTFIVLGTFITYLNEGHEFLKRYGVTHAPNDTLKYAKNSFDKDTFIVKDLGLKKDRSTEVIINGQLLNIDGIPIENGVITIEGGKSVTTDQNGQFKIKYLKNGNQLKALIFYQAEGYILKKKYISLNQYNITLRL